ncbi:hypothetical protein [Flavobacterium caeni]|uniref:Lipoprotein n=1 Tax=Flavobacterium caeni TaxID=490189 RepID=A0A1G5K2K0_9FLAO|nr:hypothetical protein [Flavobacterium caeni]SCY94684.1 hypothetical protein SAMN02927903_03045 [Flavobacterium caeni]
MKLKIPYIVLFCLAFSCCFLTSCRTSQRQETQKTEIKSETSTENIVTYQDTTIYAPKAETVIKIPVRILETTSYKDPVKRPVYYTQTNGQATAKFKAENDTIYITATCDSVAIVAKIKSQLQKSKTNNSISDKQAFEQKVTKGFSFIEMIGYSVLAFIVGFVICFLLKTFRIL